MKVFMLENNFQQSFNWNRVLTQQIDFKYIY